MARGVPRAAELQDLRAAELQQSFLRLGGDSVLAIRLSAKLREQQIYVTPGRWKG